MPDNTFHAVRVVEENALPAASLKYEQALERTLVQSLEGIIRSTPACELQPLSFFVSWSGVLTLAYSGFPPALAALKASISSCFQSLPRENPGSKWPKTSLGCLKEGRRLSEEQLELLKRICSEANENLADFVQSTPPPVCVQQLSVVVYESRSLECRISQHNVNLAPQHDPSPASEQEQRHVASVLAEAEDPNYWFHASKDGNREKHYRGPALGVTLVHDLCLDNSTEHQSASDILHGAITAFRDLVDQQLPDMYTWFADSSLHITLRSIVG